MRLVGYGKDLLIYFQKYNLKLRIIIVDSSIAYEVHIDPVLVKEEKKWYVFVGVEIKEFENIPLELFCLLLPKTKYAIITTKSDEFQEANDIFTIHSYLNLILKNHILIRCNFDSIRYFGIDDSRIEIYFYVPFN